MKYSMFNNRKFEIHSMAYNIVKNNTSVLDIGCSTGTFSKQLLNKGCNIIGIEKDPILAKVARNSFKVITDDINSISATKLNKLKFDYIVMLDTIEHLLDANNIISNIKLWIKPNGYVLCSTPNICHLSIINSLIHGSFPYTEQGLLDKTHIHFYTKKSLTELFRKHNFIIKKIYYSSDFGQLPYFGRLLRYIPKVIQYYVTLLLPRYLAPQILLIMQYD